MTALHSCLYCRRHPSTHAPATPDSDDACPLCGLGDEMTPYERACVEARRQIGCPCGMGEHRPPCPLAQAASPGPSLVCTETLPDGSQPIRLSFAIKVF